jgi:hypothetical protein
MLNAIVVVLLALWLIGVVTKIAGSVIHLLLLVALALFIWNMIKGRTTA